MFFVNSKAEFHFEFYVKLIAPEETDISCFSSECGQNLPVVSRVSLSVSCFVDFENVRKQTIVSKQTIKNDEFQRRKQLFSPIKNIYDVTSQDGQQHSEPLYSSFILIYFEGATLDG